METFVFPVGPFDTNTILLTENFSCIIIDPGKGSFELVDALVKEKGLTLKHIWLTHSHWDHIADLALCVKHYQIPVYCHPLDIPNCIEPGVDKLPLFFPIVGIQECEPLHEGQILLFEGHRFQVLHTPGHSPGSVCFYSKEDHLLISGDTLFAGSIGNLSLPTAKPEDMWQSLEKLAILPPNTQVIPGHGGKTTIEQEDWLPRAKAIFGGSL